MNNSESTIRVTDPRSAPAMALLEHHWRYTQSHSPPESVHALNIDGLTKPNVTFWTFADADEVIGCVALKELDATHGEIKSMHVLERVRGRGVGAALVQHVIEEARRRRYARLSLETGSMAAFAPARRLYARFGFAPCPPFAEYWDDPNSACMTLTLARSK